MLEKIVAQIALALFSWLEKRIQSSSTAVDADVDRERLRRAGARIDDWLREQNRLHPRGITHSSGTELQNPSVHTPTGGVGIEHTPGGTA